MEMEINLKQTQIEHYQKIRNVYDNGYSFYIDCSVMGSGKTYIALKLAQDYNLDLFVICPKSVVNNWNKLANEFEIKIHYCSTYQTFRGTKSKKDGKVSLGHNWLINEPILFRGSYLSEYRVTKQFIELLKNNEKGILFVFDEFHNLKNRTDQYRSVYEITKITSNYKNHKMAFLSSTPFDKKDSVRNVVTVTGMASEPLIIANGYEYDISGTLEFVNLCNRLNPQKTKRYFHSKRRYIASSLTNVIYKLYTEIIVPNLVFIMPPPAIEAKLDIKNSHYPIDTESQYLITEGMIKMKNAIKAMYNLGQMDMDITVGLGASLALLEEGKIGIIKKAVNEVLKMETSKAIVFVSYNKTINALKEYFKDFEPLILNGSCSLKKRRDIISKFQSHDLRYRLLISNTKVGGTGIDLHDTHGNIPRFMFLLPNFNMIDIHQACGRIYRIGTKSDAFIRLVYTDQNEQRIIESIQKKTIVLKEATDKNILYAGDYPIVPVETSFLELEQLQYKQMFNQVLMELKYLPELSVEYQEALNRFQNKDY